MKNTTHMTIPLVILGNLTITMLMLIAHNPLKHLLRCKGCGWYTFLSLATPPRPEIVSDQSRSLIHPTFDPPDQNLLIEESIRRGNDAGAAQYQDPAYFGEDGLRLLEVPDADAGRTVAEGG